MTDQCSPCSRPATWSATQIAGLVGILLLAASARFYLLGDQSLWYDESDRVFIASLPVWEIFPTMAEEGLHYTTCPFTSWCRNRLRSRSARRWRDSPRPALG
jgi:hypothetical protein